MLTKLMSAAALAAMTCTSPALAAADDLANDLSLATEMVEGRVAHADLDLTRDRDVARLKLRIERKARSLCSSRFGFERIDQQTLQCRAEVIASGAAQIDRAVEVAMLRQGKARKG